MTRIMGDATHDAVPQLAAAPGFSAVAGYVTGTADIKWTPADWARFPGIGHVTIDQGFTGSPVADAMVRDVEAGAWTISAALSVPWTAPRKVIYCSVSLLPNVAQAGWRGDTWVAWYNGNPDLDFTPPPGITVVAKQYTDLGGGGAYDLSALYDPAWPPLEDPMSAQIQNDVTYCGKCGCFYYGSGTVSVCAGNAGGPHVAANNVSFGLLYSG